jgi:hypothetical protein
MSRPRRVIRVGGDFDRTDDIIGTLLATGTQQPESRGSGRSSGRLSLTHDLIRSPSATGEQPQPRSPLVTVPSMLEAGAPPSPVRAGRTTTVVRGTELAIAIFAHGERVALWNPTDGLQAVDGTGDVSLHRAAVVAALRAAALEVARKPSNKAAVASQRSAKRKNAAEHSQAGKKTTATKATQDEPPSFSSADNTVENAGAEGKRRRRRRGKTLGNRRHYSSESESESDETEERSGVEYVVTVDAATHHGRQSGARTPTTAQIIEAPEPADRPHSPRAAVLLQRGSADVRSSRGSTHRSSTGSDLLLLGTARGGNNINTTGSSVTVGRGSEWRTILAPRFHPEVEFGDQEDDVSVLPPRRSMLARLHRRYEDDDDEHDELPAGRNAAGDAMTRLLQWTDASLRVLSVSQLKDELRTVGLSTRGPKQLLIDRILCAVNAHATPQHHHTREAAGNERSPGNAFEERFAACAVPVLPSDKSRRISAALSDRRRSRDEESSTLGASRRRSQPTAERVSSHPATPRRQSLQREAQQVVITPPKAAFRGPLHMVTSKIGDFFGSAAKRFSTRLQAKSETTPRRASSNSDAVSLTFDADAEQRLCHETQLIPEGMQRSALGAKVVNRMSNCKSGGGASASRLSFAQRE